MWKRHWKNIEKTNNQLTRINIMELREIIRIFWNGRRLFSGIVLVFVASGLLFFVLQPDLYSANLMLNVTRKGVQATDGYRYDDFYRLQADERFADTVVRWVGSPQVAESIYGDAGVSFRGSIEARRLSSQMIEVVFDLKNKDDAGKISTSVLRTLNLQTEKLDEFQKEDTWFVLVANEPYVSEKRLGLWIVLAFSAMLGLFFGAWGVMIGNYLKR
ncbi:MAG: hypothetical protein ACD_51C00058G0002 [uncultured bacterium]|nr:MAG: hypothetical protein ACD_51C00058G0002 [uncultured bacterium]